MVVALGAVMMFFPFLWTVITSLSSGLGLERDPQPIPQQPSLDAYRTLFLDLPFARVVLNSLAIATVVTFAQVLTSGARGLRLHAHAVAVAGSYSPCTSRP